MWHQRFSFDPEMNQVYLVRNYDPSFPKVEPEVVIVKKMSVDVFTNIPFLPVLCFLHMKAFHLSVSSEVRCSCVPAFIKYLWIDLPESFQSLYTMCALSPVLVKHLMR